MLYIFLSKNVSINPAANPHTARRIRNLRCSWQNSLVDRSNKHSYRYGFEGSLEM